MSFDNAIEIFKKIWDYVKRNLPLIIYTVLLTIAFLSFVLYTNNPLHSDAKINPRSIVVKAVRDVSELTTAVFEMETIVPVQERVMASTSKLLYIAHGTVRVGINLSEFGEQSINVDEVEKLIDVILPPLKILDSKLDVEHSKVYSYEKGFVVGPNPIELIPEAQKNGIQKVKQAACEPWLISVATERVESTISNLLSQNILTGKGYSINVKSSDSSRTICSETQE